MRVLDFTATGQTLKRSPGADFSGIVAGSRGYLFARFRFDREWSGCKKVAVFCCHGKEHPAGLRAGMCEIPAEALTGDAVQVYVVGRRPGFEITTDVAAFRQLVKR